MIKATKGMLTKYIQTRAKIMFYVKSNCWHYNNTVKCWRRQWEWKLFWQISLYLFSTSAPFIQVFDIFSSLIVTAKYVWFKREYKKKKLIEITLFYEWVWEKMGVSSGSSEAEAQKVEDEIHLSFFGGELEKFSITILLQF